MGQHGWVYGELSVHDGASLGEDSNLQPPDPEPRPCPLCRLGDDLVGAEARSGSERHIRENLAVRPGSYNRRSVATHIEPLPGPLQNCPRFPDGGEERVSESYFRSAALERGIFQSGFTAFFSDYLGI